MQVFLSWSGDRSRELAEALREYLPLIIQSITPWFSPEHVDKGSRWLADLTGQLQKQSVAIVCVTPECVNSPWLLFETGALSKVLDASWVCPVLLDIEPFDIKGPLAQFQATRVTKEDMRKLLATLNKRLETPLADAQINKLHETFWGDFEKRIQDIPKPATPTSTPHRTQNDLLAEVLERVRGLERRLASSNPIPTELEALYYWPRKSLAVKRPRKAGGTGGIADKVNKFLQLRDATALRIASLEKELKDLRPGKDNVRGKVEATLELERMRFITYEAEVRKASAKLVRAQQVNL